MPHKLRHKYVGTLLALPCRRVKRLIATRSQFLLQSSEGNGLILFRAAAVCTKECRPVMMLADKAGYLADGQQTGRLPPGRLICVKFHSIVGINANHKCEQLLFNSRGSLR